MARAQVIKNNFNTGEISPLALGRTDLEKYKNACELIHNWIPLVTGGMTKRPGTRFVINANSQDGPSRLVPFEFSLTQAFVLEFGNQTLRFFTNNGVIANAGVPYVIVTPYDRAVDNLWDLKFAQQADVMYIVHPNHPPMKLSRIADNNWQLTTPAFNSAPLIALDQDISKGVVSLALSAMVGQGVTATASAPVFLDGDVGKKIIGGAGNAIITAIGGATAPDPDTGATLHKTATINVLDPFLALNFAARVWLMRGPPGAYALFGRIDAGPVVHATKQLGSGVQQTALMFGTYPTEGNAPAFRETLRVIDIGRYMVIDGSVAQIVALNGPNSGGANDAQSATVQVLGPIIDTFSDSNGNIRMQPASSGSWLMQDNAFSAVQGYPRAVCFCQDRLCFAGTAGAPQTVWLSNTGDYENFSIGPQDDDSIKLTINSGQLETILSLVAFQGALLAHCARAEYAIGGGAVQFGGNSVSAITPSNATVLRQSTYGSVGIQPIVVDEDVLYVKRLGIRAGAMAFNIQQSLYATRDLSILSELITSSGFKELVYQQFPYGVIWGTTLDNNLVGLTYQKENDVWGWHRHFTGMDRWSQNADGTYSPPAATSFGGPADQFVSVASISNATTDQLWCCVARNNNFGGPFQQFTYTIEFFDPTLYVDEGSQRTFGGFVTQVGNLGYLAGRTAVGNSDGAAQPAELISVDTYTLEKATKGHNVQVGLPIIATALTVRLEMPGPQSIQGILKRFANIWVRVYNTVGLIINNKRIPFRTPAMNMGITGLGTSIFEGVPPFTGDVQLEDNLDYDRDGRILIQHDQPLPCTVLATFGTLSVGEN